MTRRRTRAARVPRPYRLVIEMATTTKLRKHRGCCECGRLKHLDGTPHGRAVERGCLPVAVREQARRGVSHGYCSECKVRLQLRYGAAAATRAIPTMIPAPLLAA